VYVTQKFSQTIDVACCDWFIIKVVLVVSLIENDVAPISTSQINKL